MRTRKQLRKLPYAGTRLVSKTLNCGSWPNRDDMTLVQRFPIKGLLRTEPRLYKHQVWYYKRLTPDHEPVIIGLYKGKKLIWNGNHRVQARIEKGLKTVRAYTFEFDCK